MADDEVMNLICWIWPNESPLFSVLNGGRMLSRRVGGMRARRRRLAKPIMFSSSAMELHRWDLDTLDKPVK